MATITPADPSTAPSLPILQVGEEDPALLGFSGMKGVADADPGNACVVGRGRVLSSVWGLRRDAGIAGPGAVWRRLVTIVVGALVAFSVALALTALPSFAETEGRHMATIAPADPSKAPSLPILQVGEEHPLLLGFSRMKGVADAAAASPGHTFVDGRGRLLFVDMINQQPVLTVSANPPPDDELLARMRDALALAVKQADLELLGEAGFETKDELKLYVQQLLGHPRLAEVVTALYDALDPDPAPDPDDPELKRRRLCKLMGTC